MKSILSTIILFFATVLLCLAKDYTEAGDSAYMNDDFPRAISLYEQALKENGTSSTLYYNLGNAYYRDGNYGKSILNYNRALKLNPSNSDARTNLDFVNSKIVDKPNDNSTLTEKIGNNVVTYLEADLWAWITLGVFLMFICCVAGYIFCNGIMLRKTFFFGGLVLLVLTISGIIISVNAASRVTADNQAIITASSVQLGTSPRVPKNKAEEAFLLHEGTQVEIVDSLSTTTDNVQEKWYEVKVDSEHRAWINAKDVERI